MNWQQMNWSLPLLISLGLLAIFVAMVYCTYLPVRYMKEPAVRKFHFRWLLALWSLWFVIGFVLPTLSLFGVLPSWLIADPAIILPACAAWIFLRYFPWLFDWKRTSTKT
jgi:hypothetical protein